MTMSNVLGGPMDTWINGLLLLLVLALPLTIVVTVHRVLRRRGLETRYQRPETIDYDKW